MNDTRPYRSPLREQQANATRAQILDALIEVVSDVGAYDLNIKDLADRAGVSERTVYRHFPDRQALLDGLFAYLDDHVPWPSVATIGEAANLRPEVERSFHVYDQHERAVRALVLMNQDPARTAAQSRSHIGLIRGYIADAFPDLNDADLDGVTAMINLLASSRTWLRLRDANDLTGEQSAKYVGWVIGLVMAELENGPPSLAE